MKKKRIARADDCGSDGYHSIVYLDAGRRKITGSSQEKQTALTMEYASFLYKLMALLRAGLTIRGAFERLAQSRQSVSTI